MPSKLKQILVDFLGGGGVQECPADFLLSKFKLSTKDTLWELRPRADIYQGNYTKRVQISAKSAEV